jgi:hypothetical protein
MRVDHSRRDTTTVPFVCDGTAVSTPIDHSQHVQQPPTTPNTATVRSSAVHSLQFHVLHDKSLLGAIHLFVEKLAHAMQHLAPHPPNGEKRWAKEEETQTQKRSASTSTSTSKHHHTPPPNTFVHAPGCPNRPRSLPVPRIPGSASNGWNQWCTKCPIPTERNGRCG